MYTGCVYQHVSGSVLQQFLDMVMQRCDMTFMRCNTGYRHDCHIALEGCLDFHLNFHKLLPVLFDLSKTSNTYFSPA